MRMKCVLCIPDFLADCMRALVLFTYLLIYLITFYSFLHSSLSSIFLKPFTQSPVAKSSARHVAALMLLVFLFAQWAGWQHRVEHANWGITSAAFAHTLAQSGQADWQISALQYHGEKTHSCLLFDAATLACSAPSVTFTLPLQTSTAILALWSAYASWDAPPLRVFSSRAPPRQ